MIEASQRERATILAALFVWSLRNLPNPGLGEFAPLEFDSAEVIARKYGPALDAEEIDGLIARLSVDLSEPCPELAGTYPVVLYLRDSKDRDELVALVQQAKPGMVTRKL